MHRERKSERQRDRRTIDVFSVGAFLVMVCPIDSVKVRLARKIEGLVPRLPLRKPGLRIILDQVPSVSFLFFGGRFVDGGLLFLSSIA